MDRKYNVDFLEQEGAEHENKYHRIAKDHKLQNHNDLDLNQIALLSSYMTRGGFLKFCYRVSSFINLEIYRCIHTYI